MQELRVAQERLDIDFKVMDCLLTMTDNREHEKVRLKAHGELCSLCTIYPAVSTTYGINQVSLESMNIYDNTLSTESVWESIKAFFKRVLDILLWLPRKIISLFKNDKPKEDLKETVKSIKDSKPNTEKLKNLKEMQTKYKTYDAYKKALDNDKLPEDDKKYIKLIKYQLEYLWCDYIMSVNAVFGEHGRFGGYLTTLNTDVTILGMDIKKIATSGYIYMDKVIDEIGSGKKDTHVDNINTRTTYTPAAGHFYSLPDLLKFLNSYTDGNDKIDKEIERVHFIPITNNDTFSIKYSIANKKDYSVNEKKLMYSKGIKITVKPEDYKGLELFGAFTNHGKMDPTIWVGDADKLLIKPLEEIDKKLEEIQTTFQDGSNSLSSRFKKLEELLKDKEANKLRSYMLGLKETVEAYTKLMAPILTDTNNCVNYICKCYNQVIKLYSNIIGYTKDGKEYSGINDGDDKDFYIKNKEDKK